jgi:2-polyprenyl-3-methyl-5-hydroxy-6-metoxy-1,4-benzoquinol methylase
VIANCDRALLEQSTRIEMEAPLGLIRAVADLENGRNSVIANENCIERPQADRIERVRDLFDHRENYLDRRQLDIRLRTETVSRVVEGRSYNDILDIGCGDGSISTPLLSSKCHLTLLDISTQMLERARSRVPTDLLSHVKVVNQNFMEAPFEEGTFDLVICVGVLAHVPSPSEVVAKIVSILKPGGTLILECTDAFHLMGRINRLSNAIAWYFKPPQYKPNLLSAKAILSMAENEGLKLTSSFRYSLPLPGVGRLFSAAGIYRMTRFMFGDVMRNHNRWFGNQFIYCFVRP